MEITHTQRQMYLSSLFGGGMAGLFVDICLFPLDTLKTRLQAAQGFKKAGGFSGVYKGLGPQAIGSAPQAALFFVTYDSLKYFAEPLVSKEGLPLVHMFSASVAEVVACVIRVPVEIVKQRRQTTKHTAMKIFKTACRSEGIRKGLFRGFGSTVLRDLPFSVIQFPILEYTKSRYQLNFKNNIPLESWEVAICGAFAGGISAAVTTPLDVVKTRIMLADKKLVTAEEITFSNTFANVYRSQGFKGLFAGFVPRVLWITLGGYIFFGTYDYSKNLFLNHVL